MHIAGDGPPPVRNGEIQEIRETVEESRAVHMDVGLWNWFEPGQAPAPEEPTENETESG